MIYLFPQVSFSAAIDFFDRRERTIGCGSRCLTREFRDVVLEDVGFEHNS